MRVSGIKDRVEDRDSKETVNLHLSGTVYSDCPENDLILTDDLLNKYRQMPPISDNQNNTQRQSCNHTLGMAPDPD